MGQYWQRETLRDAASMAFGETWEYRLPKNGQLGSLVLYISSSPGSNNLLVLPKWRLIDYISKIEVMGDGSEVIKSYDGVEAIAAAFYDDGRVPPCQWRTYATTPQRQWVPIHFGRFLQDELYGLDLSKYNQVSLKITNDATSAIWTTDINVTVIGYFLRDGAGFGAGYFREEVWKSWLPVAAATEYSVLPTSLPIRRILLEARPARDDADAKNNSTMIALMNLIDYTFRTGQIRVFHDSLERLGHLSVVEGIGEVVTRGSIDRTEAYGFEVGIGYNTSNLGVGMPDATGSSTITASMIKDIQDSAQEVGKRLASGPLSWICRGNSFCDCTPLHYARKPDLSDILDPAALDAINVDISCTTGLTLTGTSRNARNGIILSRLVR